MGMGIGIAMSVGKGVGGPVANPLFVNLQNYYKLDESSGDALDAVDSGTLTAANGPTSVAGLINTARNFDTSVVGGQFCFSTSSMFKFLQTTFAVSLWFKVDANFITNQAQVKIAGKSTLTSSTQRGWAVFLNALTQIVRIGCSPDGTSGAQVVAAKLITLTAGSWYNVVAYREFGNVIGISVNGSAYTTTSYTGNVFDNTANMVLGPNDRTQAAGNMVIDEMAIWTNFIPSATQVTWLYNSGAGRALSEYPTGPSS